MNEGNLIIILLLIVGVLLITNAVTLYYYYYKIDRANSIKGYKRFLSYDESYQVLELNKDCFVVVGDFKDKKLFLQNSHSMSWGIEQYTWGFNPSKFSTKEVLWLISEHEKVVKDVAKAENAGLITPKKLMGKEYEEIIEGTKLDTNLI